MGTTSRIRTSSILRAFPPNQRLVCSTSGRALLTSDALSPSKRCTQSCVAVSIYPLPLATARLEVIIEIPFRMNPPAYAENMGGSRMRIDLDVVPLSLPQIMSVGQEIVHLKRVLNISPQIREIPQQPFRMNVVG